MRLIRFLLMLAIIALVASVLPGCATMGVQVWDRDIVSKPEMQMDKPALERSMDDHIYFSKEASSGGRSFGGGGCGCN